MYVLIWLSCSFYTLPGRSYFCWHAKTQTDSVSVRVCVRMHTHITQSQFIIHNQWAIVHRHRTSLYCKCTAHATLTCQPTSEASSIFRAWSWVTSWNPDNSENTSTVWTDTGKAGWARKSWKISIPSNLLLPFFPPSQSCMYVFEVVKPHRMSVGDPREEDASQTSPITHSPPPFDSDLHKVHFILSSSSTLPK